MKVRRVDFSPDEWLQGAHRLGNAERGLYITACALMYSKGGSIEIAELRAATHDHGNAFNRQLQRLISLGKLEETDEKSSGNAQHLTNKRCETELEKASIRSENAAENAAKRWQTNDSAANVALPNSIARGSNANHQPSTITYQESPPKPPPRGARNRKTNGHDKWPQLADLTRAQLNGRFNTLKGPEHHYERQEIKRRLGYVVPPD